MASQYAGWQISVDMAPGPDGKSKKYFAMGSGPMRAAAGREELFDTIGHREASPVAVGVLDFMATKLDLWVSAQRHDPIVTRLPTRRSIV